MKNLIKRNFDKASDSYDNVASVQKACARILVRKLMSHQDNFYPQNVLDLGTGTGFVTEQLLQFYPKLVFTLNDLSPKMIAFAQIKFKNFSNIFFNIGDMEIENFGEYDLIVSNFSMQWLVDLKFFILKILDKAEVFAFTCLLENTFWEWKTLLKKYGFFEHLHQYPHNEQLMSFLREIPQVQIFAEEKKFFVKFQNARAFMKYLQQLGAACSVNNPSKQVIRNLILTEKNEIIVTYEVLFVVIKKQK